MNGSFGLFGTTPSSWKRKEFGLRLLTASRRSPRDGRFHPVTFSIFSFTLSSTPMMPFPRVCRAYRGLGAGGRDDPRQHLGSASRRPAVLERLRETLEHAVLEGGDHRIVHIALAANRAGIGEILGCRAHGLQHLFAALALVCCGLGTRKHLEHARRCQQRTKVLQ